jgi:hypothetical protein
MAWLYFVFVSNRRSCLCGWVDRTLAMDILDFALEQQHIAEIDAVGLCRLESS